MSKLISEDHLKNKELFDKINLAINNTFKKQVPFILSGIPLAIKIVLVTIALSTIFMLALPQSKPVLSLSSNLPSHDFGEITKGDSASWEFSIRNAGDETLNWNIVDNQPWITVNPQKGTNSGNVMINIDTSDLKPGDHSGIITINSNGGDSSGNINVEVIQVPLLSVSPDVPSHDFGEIYSGDSASWEFSIWNSGGGTLNWNIVNNQPWITVNPQKGTNSGIVTVEVNTVDLYDFYYSGTIAINSNGGYKSGEIEIDVINPVLLGPDLVVSTFKTIGSPTINSENNVVLPVQVIIKNQGDSDASSFKVATEYTGKSGTYVVAFTVKGQNNIWYPYTSISLKPEETVTFDGIVTFHSSIHKETITLWAVADSCSGDEFMPNYCRVDESNETNNYAPSISIFLP